MHSRLSLKSRGVLQGCSPHAAWATVFPSLARSLLEKGYFKAPETAREIVSLPEFAKRPLGGIFKTNPFRSPDEIKFRIFSGRSISSGSHFVDNPDSIRLHSSFKGPDSYHSLRWSESLSLLQRMPWGGSTSLRYSTGIQQDSKPLNDQNSNRESTAESSHAHSEPGNPGRENQSSQSSNESTNTKNSSNESSEKQGKSSSHRAQQIWNSAYKHTFQNLKSLSPNQVIEKVKMGYTFLSEELSRTTPRKTKRKIPKTTQRSSSTAVMIAPTSKPSGWRKRWHDILQKARNHPVFHRVRNLGRPVIDKSQEIADDIRDRWETSDNPMVHRIQDMNESLFGETLSAIAMREIRRRDPEFTLLGFVQDVQADVRPILLAYLKGDEQALRKFCSNEVVERCRAERRAFEVQGFVRDSKILHISELEVRETKMVGKDPVIIVNFKTQQTHCTRDKHGNITEGGMDEIHSVFYAWAMQLNSPEDHEDEEEMYEPKWQLREMQQLGVQALI